MAAPLTRQRGVGERGQTLSRLCIIPARGGSKRFPRKNIAPFQGSPLLARTVAIARESTLFNRIVVSTEDPEIAEIAATAGADIDHRDPRLATDSARLVDVCKTLLSHVGDAGRPDAFCLLLPTSPFRTVEDILESYRLLTEHRANAVMSISEFPHVPLWAIHVVNREVRLFFGKRWLKSRDRLPVLYRHNGVVLWMRTSAFRRYGEFYCPRVVPYVMDLSRSVDIDHALDLEFAEFLAGRRT